MRLKHSAIPIRIPCTTVFPRLETWHAGMPPDQPGIVRENVPCEGHLVPCEICGRERWCTREARCLDDQAVTHLALRFFNIDGVYEIPLVGYTRGERWNGWACPRFPLASALALMEQINEEAPGTVEYHAAVDRFVVRFDDVEPDEWKGEPLETPAGVITVYPIGAWAWCWEVEKPEPEHHEPGCGVFLTPPQECSCSPYGGAR